MTEIKEIRPLERVNAELQVPGSKSYTQRALVIASLADGKSILRNTLVSEDTQVLAESPAAYGCRDRHLGQGHDRHGNGRAHPKSR